MSITLLRLPLIEGTSELALIATMTKVVSVPEFEATALEAIPKLAASSRLAFRTHKTKNIRWRQVQLRKLYWALEDYGPHILNALMSDLHKSEYESLLTELDWVKNDCLFMLDNMEKFAKDDKLGSPQVPLTFSMMKLRVKKEPLGAVLIIGPYNYPIQLTLGPLIGAIAAGCTAVIKPSELTPATAAVIKALIENRLDTKAFAVVNGSIPEVNALMDEKWDKIMFTGSAAVGTIIAKKAAETLTPVCLELGGKNPAFVTKNANLALAARRLLWSKTLNVGQVCLAQNYVLVDKEVVSSFIEFLKAAYKEMFPQGARASADLSRVVNQRHFQRLKAMLDATKGKIVMGGDMDEADLFIEPTAVLVDSKKDSMVVDEAFGPIFAILPYNSLDEALNVAYSVHKTPLSLFSFGSDAENAKGLTPLLLRMPRDCNQKIKIKRKC